MPQPAGYTQYMPVLHGLPVMPPQESRQPIAVQPTMPFSHEHVLQPSGDGKLLPCA
jgi:hypothetical protein